MKAQIVLLFLAILIVSCGDDTSQFDMNVQLSFEDSPLIMAQDYTYPDGRTIRFNRVSFFMSDLTVSNGTESVELFEAQHINLTQSHVDAASAAVGFQVISEDLEMSDISSATFNLGLTPAQNAMAPNEYPVESDLSNSAEYWIGWESYVFAKIEGLIDLDNDGNPESTFALHLGSDDIMRTITMDGLDQSGDNYSLDIDIDVQSIFESNGAVFDIVETTNIHSLVQINEANFLIDNWQAAIQRN